MLLTFKSYPQDIERALNKLEHVAIKFRLEKNRTHPLQSSFSDLISFIKYHYYDQTGPLVLVFNNIHFVHDDEAGVSHHDGAFYSTYP